MTKIEYVKSTSDERSGKKVFVVGVLGSIRRKKQH